MTNNETLVKSFKAAKERIFVLFSAESDDPTSAIYDKAALNIASNDYGGLIDKAVEQLKRNGNIDRNLKAMFDIKIRNHPYDNGLGGGRSAVYHDRFVKEIAPIMTAVPIDP